MFRRYVHGAEATRQGRSGLRALLGRFLPSWPARRAIGALEHLGTLPLTAQSSLALVRLYDETLLLGITQQHIAVLAKRPNDALPDSAPPGSLAR